MTKWWFYDKNRETCMSNLLLVESWLSLQLWLLSIFHTPSIITLYVVHVSVRANGSNIVVLWQIIHMLQLFSVTRGQCYKQPICGQVTLLLLLVFQLAACITYKELKWLLKTRKSVHHSLCLCFSGPFCLLWGLHASKRDKSVQMQYNTSPLNM